MTDLPSLRDLVSTYRHHAAGRRKSTWDGESWHLGWTRAAAARGRQEVGMRTIREQLCEAGHQELAEALDAEDARHRDLTDARRCYMSPAQMAIIQVALTEARRTINNLLKGQR